MVEHPVPVGVGGDVGPLVGIGEQVEDLGHPQLHEGLGPDLASSLLALLLEHKLPVVVAQAHQVAVVGEVEELLAGALVRLARPVVEHVVAIEMDAERFVPHLVSREQFLLDLRLAGRCQ